MHWGNFIFIGLIVVFFTMSLSLIPSEIFENDRGFYIGQAWFNGMLLAGIPWVIWQFIRGGPLRSKKKP